MPSLLNPISAAIMIPRIKIPTTELDVTRLCLGTASLGTKQSEAEGHALLDRYLDMGGNFIDTARVYSDWIEGERGRVERIMGDWLRKSPGKRDRFVLATKGMAYEWPEKSFNRVTYEYARMDIEKSLEVLGVDEIDLYFLHRDSLTLSPEEIIDFLQVFIEEGKIRYLGVANWNSDRLEAANAYAKKEGKHGFVANQPQFSLASWNMATMPDSTLFSVDRKSYDFHSRENLAMTPYSSQALGFFTKALGEVEADREALAKNRFHNDANLKVAEVVKELARKKGCNANGIVLGYLVSQPFPILPIVGCHQESQLEDSFNAVAVKLEKEELQALEDASGSGISH